MKKTFLAFIFTAFLGSVGLGQTPTPTPAITGDGRAPGIGTGSGTGQGNGTGSGSSTTLPNNMPKGETATVRILSKPRPAYTEEAKKNAVEGVVRLKVTFLASGEIGTVAPVIELPDGLTEQAILAARAMKFEPGRKDGFPVSMTKTVEYRFSLFFHESDPQLVQKAEILEMPTPARPQDENEIQRLGGKIKLSVAFSPDGTVFIYKIHSDLSAEFAQKVKDAVAKIKFKPAMHQNGNAVTQGKEIEYVFSETQK